jgi:hypothetical protein
MSAHDYLTGLLREIADLFSDPGEGLRAALAVAEAKGGREAHFPFRAPDDHWLTQAVGRAAADIICAHFRSTQRGGVRLLVPLGPHNFYARARRHAARLSREGASAAEAARLAGLHTRTVWRVRARMKDVGDDDQGSLF